ncbi:MAG: SBBP repeat-containing protein [candidate division Zixibacteria bacterium]|nr:SBBP repeat-containing protein [candidate division Zixibacteria bacterium]
MKRSMALVMGLMMLLTVAAVAEQADTVWVRRAGSAGHDEPRSLALDRWGNVIVTGHWNPSDVKTSAMTIKYSKTGETLWMAAFDDTVCHVYAKRVEVDSSGFVYVAGEILHTGPPYTHGIVVIKYSPSGDTAWVRIFHRSPESYEVANGLAVDESGNVYITGSTQTLGGEANYEFLTLKYSPAGVLEWSRFYKEPNYYAEALAMSLDNSGNICVTGGATLAGSGFWVFATIKYYPNGDTAWLRKYCSPLNRGDKACGIAVDHLNNVFVTGTSYIVPTASSGYWEAWATVKYDSLGNQLWDRTYSYTPTDCSNKPNDICVDDLGNAYLTGWSLPWGAGDTRQVTIKYLPNGDTAWVRVYHGLYTDEGTVIRTDSDGGVYVAGSGYVVSQGGGQFQLMKYSPIGDLSWVTHFKGTLHSQEATGMALDGLGGIYVALGSGEGNLDWATVRYVQYEPTEIRGLLVEGQTNPLNIVVHEPRISWTYFPHQDTLVQSYFEIAVGTDTNWTDAEMWSPAPFVSSDTSIVYAGAPLVDGMDYWLRLRVKVSSWWSPWSQLRLRMNSIPTIPQLRMPLPEALMSSQHPDLIVHNSTDAENDSLFYTFEVSPSNFATTIFTFTKKQDADSLTTLIVDSTLVENGQYWWRAKAWDHYESSSYTPVWSFYVNSVNTAPTAVSLTQPANTIASALTILRPQFVWTPSTDPDPLDTVKYDLVIAIDSHFTFVQQILDLTAPSHTLTTDLLWGKCYWWNVRAADRNGGSTWSPQVFTFRTVTLGDANNDEAVDISDAVYLISYIFSGGSAPSPLLAGDANCDGTVDISDVVYLIAYIFSGGSAPCSAF